MISMAAFDLIIDQICKGLLGFTSVQFQRELLVLNPLIILINIIVTKMMGCKMMQNWWKVIKSNENGGKSNCTNRRACEQVSIVQVCWWRLCDKAWHISKWFCVEDLTKLMMWCNHNSNIVGKMHRHVCAIFQACCAIICQWSRKYWFFYILLCKMTKMDE